jgi:hypothetical protein
MDAYNLAVLEERLLERGWTVSAEDHVVSQDIPGQVHRLAYIVTLKGPTGGAATGSGPTRSDALRLAVMRAGLRSAEEPYLR